MRTIARSMEQQGYGRLFIVALIACLVHFESPALSAGLFFTLSNRFPDDARSV